MRAPLRIELVYFTGCPHVERARAAIRDALADSGLPQQWEEWNQYDAAAPARILSFASPTVLVEGRDVTDEPATSAGPSCRAAPGASAATIRAALVSQANHDG